VAVACQGDGGTNGRTDGDLCLLHDPNPNPNPNRSKVIHELLIPQLAGLANADRKLAKRQRGFVKNTRTHRIRFISNKNSPWRFVSALPPEVFLWYLSIFWVPSVNSKGTATVTLSDK